MLTKLLIYSIHAYRWLISPYLQPRCRFDPSCSRYAIHALGHHGLKTGTWLIIKRLMRCHPIESLGGSSGYDPVPEIQQ